MKKISYIVISKMSLQHVYMMDLKTLTIGPPCVDSLCCFVPPLLDYVEKHSNVVFEKYGWGLSVFHHKFSYDKHLSNENEIFGNLEISLVIRVKHLGDLDCSLVEQALYNCQNIRLLTQTKGRPEHIERVFACEHFEDAFEEVKDGMCVIPDKENTCKRKRIYPFRSKKRVSKKAYRYFVSEEASDVGVVKRYMSVDEHSNFLESKRYRDKKASTKPRPRLMRVKMSLVEYKKIKTPEEAVFWRIKSGETFYEARFIPLAV